MVVADSAHQPARRRVRATGVVATVGLDRLCVQALMTDEPPPDDPLPVDRVKPPGTSLTIWVIYEHPRDYPEGYVLRAQFAMDDGTVQSDEVVWVADHPDKLRAIVPLGLVRMERSPGDNPVILETWI